jgi:hypothetical protein
MTGSPYILRRAGERPPTTNAERRNTRWDRADSTATWRTDFFWRAKQHHIPPLDRIRVVAIPHHANRRSPQDTGACAPAVKAAIDGLVDAGVIPDDNGRHVSEIVYRAPVIDGWDGLELHIWKAPPCTTSAS